MIQEHNVGATFDRSNVSQSKILQEGSIGRDRQRLIDRTCFDSRCNSLPRLHDCIPPVMFKSITQQLIDPARSVFTAFTLSKN